MSFRQEHVCELVREFWLLLVFFFMWVWCVLVVDYAGNIGAVCCIVLCVVVEFVLSVSVLVSDW